jgi:hypothetical protein
MWGWLCHYLPLRGWKRQGGSRQRQAAAGSRGRRQAVAGGCRLRGTGRKAGSLQVERQLQQTEGGGGKGRE